MYIINSYLEKIANVVYDVPLPSHGYQGCIYLKEEKKASCSDLDLVKIFNNQRKSRNIK